MKQHSYLRTTIYILVVVVLVLTVVNSIYINPAPMSDFQIQIDNPVETYIFYEPINLSQIVIASTYVGFNDTFFNITTSNAISITIRHIDENPLAPESGTDDLVIFMVNNTPGDVYFNISGFVPTISYTILKQI